MGGFVTRQPLAGMKVAILGAGKMGGILLQAFLKSKVLEPEQIAATVQHEERAGQLAAQWGVDVSTDNVAAARDANLILIGLKPGTVPEVVRQIRPVLSPNTLLISIAASVRTEQIEHAADMEIGTIRAMPNTPSMLGAGIAALSSGKYATQAQMDLASLLFSTVGRTVQVEEKHLDAVTGLSGCGPAFICSRLKQRLARPRWCSKPGITRRC
jgi:pyrroline-5-carboxylate reductase